MVADGEGDVGDGSTGDDRWYLMVVRVVMFIMVKMMLVMTVLVMTGGG